MSTAAAGVSLGIFETVVVWNVPQTLLERWANTWKIARASSLRSSSSRPPEMAERYVAGTKMRGEDVVWVAAPAAHAPPGTCAWCGEAFNADDDGDMRRIDMLTKNDDGEPDWLSGDQIHGDCDYERHDATMEALLLEEGGE
jgi:hypothetical protein